MSDSPRLKRWRWTIFGSTWLIYAGLYFCRKAFYAVKTALHEEQGFSYADLGDIGIAYLLAYTAGQFVSASLGTKTGPRILLLLGMATSALCNVAFGFGDLYGTFLAFMVINGFAQATGWPGCIGVLARWTRRKERGRLLAVWGTCYQLGGVLATAWASFWLHQEGWRASFFAASSVLMVIWGINVVLLRNGPSDVGLEELEELEPEGDRTEGTDDAASEGTDGEDGPIWTRQLIHTVLLLGVFYFGVKFIRYALWSWAPILLRTSFDVTRADAGYLSTVFDIAGFLGVLCAGFLSDKVFGGRRARVSFFMLLGMMAGCGLLVLIGRQSLPLFALTLGLVGFMLFGPDSLITGAGAMDLGGKRAALAAAGLINGMGSVGSVVQELAVSRVLEESDGRPGPVLLLLLLASALSVSALGVVLWRNRRGLSDV